MYAFEKSAIAWMERHGHRLLRYSLGIVFFWFGILKFFGLSPANELAAKTIPFIPAHIFIPLLATWEVAIGAALIFRPLLRLGILLMGLQMLGTFLPLVTLPGITWRLFPIAPTLAGQYIIKNLVLVAAGMVVGGTILHKESKIEV